MSGGLVAVLERARDLGLLGPGPVEDHLRHTDAFLAAVPAPPSTLLDLGSGGGVPGLILATHWPSTSIVLVDGQTRRTAFLARAVTELDLASHVTVVTARAEELARDPRHRHAYEVVTARSFGPPAVTAECGAPLLVEAGRLIVAEPPEAPDVRWPAEGLTALGLRDEGIVRTVGATVRVLRAAQLCSERFPRRTGVPAKRPLFG